MYRATSPLSPEIWLQDLFDCNAVKKGQVIRRARQDIERFVGMRAFMMEIERRGFQVVENSDQIVIFCNRAPIRRLAPLSSKESG